MKKRNILILCLAFVVASNFFGIRVHANDTVVNEIKDILDKYYVDGEATDFSGKNTAEELIKSLNDPYTQVLDLDYYNSMVNASYFGIGITIRMLGEGAEVTSVMFNSPAFEGGLQEGDIIISIDDIPIKEMTTSFALKTLNGKAGITNKLLVKRGNESFIIYIQPGNVYYPTVYSKMLVGDIAYIHISSFGTNTVEEFNNKINMYSNKKVSGYIIDLRNNPGGYIFSAAEIASFYAKKEIVAIGQTKNGEKFKITKSPDKSLIQIPSVFLVNRNTASAAEVLAACAQDYGTAYIVGEKTYGKGAAQNTFQLSDGSILKTTTLKLYTPKGKDISNIGISPDVYIEDNYTMYAAELLFNGRTEALKASNTAELTINGFIHQINMLKLIDKNYWEVYRQMLGQASSNNITRMPYKEVNISKYKTPYLTLAEKPKTKYKLGERVSIKLFTPNYTKNVQYRAMLWDEYTNRYYDLWDTQDRYYNNWKPRGNSVFNISFPINRVGNYRIKIFVKRAGVQNSKTLIKGMNCDSYIYEIPFSYVN